MRQRPKPILNITAPVLLALSAELTSVDGSKSLTRDVKFSDGMAIRVTVEMITEDQPHELRNHTAKLVHSTPDGDQMIADLARVSNTSGEKKSTDAQLIGYLIRNNHWSPFQMASMCIDVGTTRPIGRQILRHLSAIGYQEFSGRYAEYGELLNTLECRFQHPTNRQLSRPPATPEEDHIADEWDAYVADLAERMNNDYRYWLDKGVAKEQARGILPEGLVPSRLYLHFSVRTWIHYIRERTAPGVQREHRWIALQCEEILAQQYPMVAAAVGINPSPLDERTA